MLNATIQVGSRKRVTMRAMDPERVGTPTTTGFSVFTAFWMLLAINPGRLGCSGTLASTGARGRWGSVAAAISANMLTASTG